MNYLGDGWNGMTKHRLSSVGKVKNQISHFQHNWAKGYVVLGRVRWSGNKETAPFKPSSVRIRDFTYPPIMKAGKEWCPPIVDGCLRCLTVWHKRKGQKVSV